jgi:outer membrane protein assembly factor BamB
MRTPKTLLVATVLALLLIVSEFAAISIFSGNAVNVSNAPIPIAGTSNYSDLQQYEWPQFQGDASFTRFSAGPAPDAPDILWKTNITDIQSYISAFNGMVFVTTKTTVFALDTETGSVIWNTTVPAPGRWPAVYKIDDTHMVVGSSCLDIATGRILWNSTDFSANTATFAAGAYSPEEKMFYVKTQSLVQAWNFSDPSNPPVLSWETYVPGGGSVGSGVQYGDGKLFPGSFEPHQMALDAENGSVLWDTETKAAMIFAGTYYQGKFLKGGAHDNTFYCFDADTGKILWTYNPGTEDGYWCTGSAAAYGMVYELNKDGYLYALDVNTGDVVWKYKGPGPLFFPGNPIVADGKIYVTTGQRASYDPSTGNYSKSEFVCLDAYTGHVIWKLPVEAYSPRESTAIAYGNLYMIPGFVQEEQMDQYTTINQVWAIGTRAWPMWRHDPAHTAIGQSGPTNLVLRWNFTANGAVVSSPSIADGLVYFGSQDKNIYCLNAQTGSLVWKFETGERIESSPAVVNGRVYTGADDGTIYCLDAYNGSVIWERPAGGDVPANFNAAVILRSSPAVVGDRLYVGSLDNKTYCLDTEFGLVDWTFQTQGYITSSPAVVDGVVYVISQEPTSGGLYLLDAKTGSLIQRITIPYQQAYMGTDMMSSPTVADGMIFVASNKKAYYGINATTGNIMWTYKDDAAQEFIICSPIYNDGTVYLIDEFFIVAVDAYTGQPIWKTFLGAELYVSPSYASDNLYVTTDERSMYVVNASDGEKLSYFGTSSNSWSSPTFYDGKVYVGNNDWNVYCLAEYPALNSSVTIELSKSKVVLGESVAGIGHLYPGMANASVTVSFVNPNGIVVPLQVTTSEGGAFSFSYTPNTAGTWNVAAQWQSDKSYYLSAYSERAPVEVTAAPTATPTSTPNGMPLEYIYVAVVVIAIIVVNILVYAYMRRKKK